MLTPEQELARKGKMTGSRIGALMFSNKDRILQLWLELTGQAEPENLDDVWAVQLGTCTEKLQLDWYERKNKYLLTRRGEVVTHSGYEWAAATLDGWDDALKCPIECKHVGGREPMEIIIDRYQPQLQWQMLVTGAEQCGLSVIMGANEPVVDFIPRSQAYINMMVERANRFMLCVALGEPPVTLEPVPPPAEAKLIINMNGNNQWTCAAIDWMQNQGFAEKFEDAKKILKNLVPPEAARCFGAGVAVTRDRANRLHIREER